MGEKAEELSKKGNGGGCGGSVCLCVCVRGEFTELILLETG